MLRSSAYALMFAFCTLSCAGTMKGDPAAGGGAPSSSGGSGSDGSGGTSSSGDTTPASGGTAHTGGESATGGQGGSSGGTASTGGSGGGGGETPTCLGVRLVGRHDTCTQSGVRQAWSGAGFVARFEGTGLTFDQDGPAVEYTIVVDGSVQNKVVSQAGQATTVAAASLSAGEHVVEVYRRGEASFGTTTLLGVAATDGSLLSPPAAPPRLIELVGDSITCGYGNEGADTSCGFSADTENHYMAYGAILARSYGAEVSTVAWSGRGVVNNYSGEAGPTLPDLYERAIPAEEGNVWGFAGTREPNLVVINLSTNDYSTDHDPTDEEFVSTYQELLATIRGHYPSAAILCTVGPLLSGADLNTARTNIAAAVGARMAAGDDNVRAYDMTTPNDSPGCDWHPSIPTHTAMAAELAPVVADMLGW